MNTNQTSEKGFAALIAIAIVVFVGIGALGFFVMSRDSLVSMKKGYEASRMMASPPPAAVQESGSDITTLEKEFDSTTPEPIEAEFSALNENTTSL